MQNAARRWPPPFSPAVRGFTLIELIITVVVIAVLASIAMPSLLDAIRKSRRSEAIAALNAVQQAQERYRANNMDYSSNLSAAPTAAPGSRGLGLSSATPSGYYTITLVSGSATSYEATATAVAGTSQANDANCAKLGVMADRGNLLYAGGSAGTAFTSASYTASQACWAR